MALYGGPRDAVSVPHNLEILAPRPLATVRLVCFPWAGAEGPAEYRALKWAQLFPDFIEVAVFRWSGRGTRCTEPVWTDFSWLPTEIQACLDFLAEKPFALFGHSMGSCTAYEFARWLTLNGSLRPLHVFVSGTVPPPHHIHLHSMSLAGLSRQEQLVKLAFLSGMSVQKLKSNDYSLFNHILPNIEPDLRLTDVYRERCRSSQDKQPVLMCTMTAFVGLADVQNVKKIDDWKLMTSGSTKVHQFEGGHFYFMHKSRRNLDRLAMLVATELSSVAVVSKL